MAHAAFAPFALTAHANAQTAAHAVFHTKPLDFAAYEGAKMLTDPVQARVVMKPCLPTSPLRRSCLCSPVWVMVVAVAVTVV